MDVKRFVCQHWIRVIILAVRRNGVVNFLVALVLIGAFASTIAFAATYGCNVPFGEEWEVMGPVLAGKQPVTLHWLWSQSNEHRVPVPKLVLLGLLKLTNCDFRAGMFFNVLALGAMSVVVIRVARRLRGSTSLCDAFFPLVFLHWGHFENLLWSWQVQFLCSTVLSCLLLTTIVARGRQLTAKSSVMAGVCLLLLPLCGANGLALLPPLAMWLAYEGIVTRRTQPHAGLPSGAMLAFALASLSIGALYLLDYEPVAGHSLSADVGASLLAGLNVFGMALGASFRDYWVLRSLLLACLILPSVAILLRNWRQKDERPRIVGLLLFPTSLLCLAAAIGWGRSALGFEAAFAARYVTLMAPALCWVYFVWEIYGSPRIRRPVQGLLFLLALAMFFFNVREGQQFGFYRREAMTLFTNDLREGIPPFVLAEHYSGHPYHLYPKESGFAESMRMLHEAGIGLFRELRADPIHQEIKLDPESVRDAQERKIIQLPQARRVYAIRVTFTPPGGAPTALRVVWRNSGRDGTAASDGSGRFFSRPQERESAIVWVNDVIDEFRVFHNRPSARLKQATLIVAPSSVSNGGL
jgi:hypothetical protein